MRKLLLGALLATAATAAFASDLPTRKAPPFLPPPVASWTGLYIGVNAGYTWSGRSATVTAMSAGQVLGQGEVPQWEQFAAGERVTALLNTNGFIGGGQIGYNQQIGSRLVAGVEFDMVGLASHAKTVTFVAPGAANTLSVGQMGRAWDWGGGLTARAGFLLMPNLLIYGRGGLAFAHAAFGVNGFANGFAPFYATGQAAFGNPGKVYTGWQIGGGGEFRITPNWSVFTEYRYADFGTITSSFNGVAYGATGINAVQQFVGTQRVTQHIVKAGVNFHFDTGLNLPNIN